MNRTEGDKTLVVGITGGIGAGKSVISRVLRCNGFTVFDCDYEARKLMENDSVIKKAIIKVLGTRAYTEKGIDRRFIAGEIFKSSEKRAEINKIVHHAIKELIKKKIDTFKESLFFIESAILFTANLTEMCDRIWLVEAKENIRVKRIKKRDHLSDEEINNRIIAQSEEIRNLPESKLEIINNNQKDSILTEICEKINNYNELKSYA